MRLCAPGENILSTARNNIFDYASGTSFAVPSVSGLAALLFSQNPDWTNLQVRARIEDTCDPIDHLNPAYAGKLGKGRINARKALQEEEVIICDSSWNPLPWDTILKVGDTLYIQASKAEGNPNIQEEIVVTIKSNITKPEGTQVTLTETTPTSDLYQGSTVITSSLVAKGEDGVEEFSDADVTDPYDSDTFGIKMNLLEKKDLGEARKEGDEEKMVPPVNIAFMRAAGMERLTAIYGDSSDTAFVRNQADWFYYSGHGSHTSGKVQMGDRSMAFGPSEAMGQWNEDLDTVMFAACAILDVNDYNGNYNDDWWPWPEPGPREKIFPGERWANVGPKYLLGYNYIAPLGPVIDTLIIKRWSDYLPAMEITQAWLEANKVTAEELADEKRAKGEHACAIDEQGYWYLKPIKIIEPKKKYKIKYEKIGPIPMTEW